MVVQDAGGESPDLQQQGANRHQAPDCQTPLAQALVLTAWPLLALSCRPEHESLSCAMHACLSAVGSAVAGSLPGDDVSGAGGEDPGESRCAARALTICMLAILSFSLAA